MVIWIFTDIRMLTHNECMTNWWIKHNVDFLGVILCYRNARCHHWGNWLPGIYLLFLIIACESTLAQKFSKIYKERELIILFQTLCYEMYKTEQIWKGIHRVCFVQMPVLIPHQYLPWALTQVGLAATLVERGCSLSQPFCSASQPGSHGKELIVCALFNVLRIPTEPSWITWKETGLCH